MFNYPIVSVRTKDDGLALFADMSASTAKAMSCRMLQLAKMTRFRMNSQPIFLRSMPQLMSIPHSVSTPEWAEFSVSFKAPYEQDQSTAVC